MTTTQFQVDGFKVDVELNADNIVSDNATLASNNPGTDINVTAGTGDGTGNGGGVVITAGAGGGSGVQGTITFSALDSTAPLPVNETGDEDLLPSFTATSIVGALNELKGDVVTNAVQNVYTTDTDLDYNGTTIQDLPGTVEITAGTWMINFSAVFTTSDPNVPVAIFVRDTANTILTNSKTFNNDVSSSQRYTISKQFIYTEASPTNTLKLSYQLDSGVATTVAIEMSPLAVTPDPDQFPLLTATLVETTSFQNAYTTLTDLDYNGTTEVDVPGIISLTAGTYLIGYSLTLRTPSVADNTLIFVQDSTNTPIQASRTFFTKNTTQVRQTITKAFVFTASALNYRLTFRKDTTAGISPAVEMQALSGVADPDQVPVLWAVDLTGLTNVQNTYTTLTDINYSGTTEVDIPGSIALTSGTWVVGYTLALRAPNVSDSPIVHVRDASNNIVPVSQTFLTEAGTSNRRTVTKSYIFTETSNVSYKLSFRLDTSSATSVAVEMTGFSSADPDQVPLLWAIRVGDASLTNTFLGLSDTPNSYVGQSKKLVRVNPSETALEFTNLASGTNDNVIIRNQIQVDFGENSISALQTRIASGGNVFIQAGTYAFTSNLTLPSDIALIGSEQGITTFTFPTTVGNGIVFNAVSNVTFKGITFDLSGGTSLTTLMIILGSSTNILVRDCTFIGPISTMMSILDSSNVTFDNCVISNCTTGLFVNTGFTISNVKVSKCTFTSVSAVPISVVSDNSYITNCTVTSSGPVIIGAIGVRGIVCDSNTIVSATSIGISIAGGTVTVSNNTINMPVTQGINISVATNVTIANNTILFPTSTGIISTVGGQVNIIGNSITSPTNQGINLTASVDGIISNNIITSATTDGIAVAGGQLNIINNIIDNPTLQGINFTVATDGVVSNNTIISTTTAIAVTASGNKQTIQTNTIDGFTVDSIAVTGTGNLNIKNNRIDTQTYTPSAPTALVGTVGTNNTFLGTQIYTSIAGTGTAFTTDFVAGDIISYSADQRAVVNTVSTTTLFIHRDLVSIGAGFAYTRADRLTVNGYNQSITINASTNPSRVILPDLEAQSTGHMITITKTGTNLVTITPTNYADAVFRELTNTTTTIELTWNGQEWKDAQYRPTLMSLTTDIPEIIATSSLTPIPWNRTISSTGGLPFIFTGTSFGPARNFVAHRTGWYQCEVAIQFLTVVSTFPAYVGFRLNGSVIHYINRATTQDDGSRISSGRLNLTAGNTIEIVVFQSSGGNRTITATGTNTLRFSVQYLGEFA